MLYACDRTKQWMSDFILKNERVTNKREENARGNFYIHTIDSMRYLGYHKFKFYDLGGGDIVCYVKRYTKLDGTYYKCICGTFISSRMSLREEPNRYNKITNGLIVMDTNGQFALQTKQYKSARK